LPTLSFVYFCVFAPLREPSYNGRMSKLVVENLVKHYTTPAEPLVILDGVSLSLSAGENLAIIGPSGSGKSTLLAILGTLETPTSGSVRLEETDPFALDERELAAFRGDQIGFVFQDHYLLPQCTVWENVLVPLLASGPIDSAGEDRARDLIDRVGLSGRLTHRPAELSGGERQRTAIARALVREPSLVLADEPTGNLDNQTAAAISKLLLELQAAQETMLIVVTHSTLLAGAMQRRMRLEGGKLVGV
jgi:lipoprotein-releasing system ATP-binding protein